MTFFSGKNILITGSNGYIGSSIVNILKKYPCRLYLLSRSGGKSEKDITHIKADISRKGVWKKILKNINIVYHLAAQTSSYYANLYPLEDLKINVLPIIDFIETCQKYGFSPDIIFAGTVTQVGFTKKGKITENYKDLPITIYDINKLTAEKYLQYYSNQLKKRAVILRLPNIYGPGPSSSKSDRGIVNLMIKKAIKGEPITIFGNGQYIRDYLYIDDAVNAFVKAGECIEKTKGNYYVLGTGIGYTIYDVAKIIQDEVKKIIEKKIDITFTPFPKDTSKIEYRNFIADNSKFINDTGFFITTSLRDGIRKTIKYFMNL